MSEPAKNPFDLLLDQIRVVVREEVERALDRKQPSKLQFNVKEAAQRLNVRPSWLGSKIRAGELPHHRQGHFIFLTQQDIDEIQARSAVSPKNGNG
jgi:hypothetical protein